MCAQTIPACIHFTLCNLQNWLLHIAIWPWAKNVRGIERKLISQQLGWQSALPQFSRTKQTGAHRCFKAVYRQHTRLLWQCTRLSALQNIILCCSRTPGPHWPNSRFISPKFGTEAKIKCASHPATLDLVYEEFPASHAIFTSLVHTWLDNYTSCHYLYYETSRRYLWTIAIQNTLNPKKCRWLVFDNQYLIGARAARVWSTQPFLKKIVQCHDQVTESERRWLLSSRAVREFTPIKISIPIRVTVKSRFIYMQQLFALKLFKYGE